MVLEVVQLLVMQWSVQNSEDVVILWWSNASGLCFYFSVLAARLFDRIMVVRWDAELIWLASGKCIIFVYIFIHFSKIFLSIVREVLFSFNAENSTVKKGPPKLGEAMVDGRSGH